jgi:hypothetical protein
LTATSERAREQDVDFRGKAVIRTTAAAILAAALTLTSPAYACMTMSGFEPINSGKLWKSWTSSDRLLYLWGFQDGSSRVVFHFGPIDEKAKKDRAGDSSALRSLADTRRDDQSLFRPGQCIYWLISNGIYSSRQT